ncbi:MAG: hypothetical protein ACYC3X_04525 [Pirellulaceae bacterium]
MPTIHQRLLFDAERAGAARDEAMSAVADNANPNSCAAIYGAIVAPTGELPVFTTDDVWARVPQENRLAIEPRMIGYLMIAAAKCGHVERLDGVFLASDMVRCHRRPKMVWRWEGESQERTR